jgi:hypothetical protein
MAEDSDDSKTRRLGFFIDPGAFLDAAALCLLRFHSQIYAGNAQEAPAGFIYSKRS